MEDNKYIHAIKEILYSEAKINRSNHLKVGSTPKDAGVCKDDLNEIDMVFTGKGIRIKCFYDKISNSANSSPFYLDIDNNELEIWIDGCKEFAQKPKTTSLADKLKTKEKGW